VYDIALEVIAHGDGRVIRKNSPVRGRLPGGDPLKLGELWAIPIMLAPGLDRDLRRVASGSPPPGSTVTAPTTGPTR